MFVGPQCGRAEEAITRYVELFPDSRIVGIEHGDDGVFLARFVLAGREYRAMDSSADHHFTFTPAVSLVVETDDAEQIAHAFTALADGGTVLMPLGEYPFSPAFGWVNDRYGVSWQLLTTQ